MGIDQLNLPSVQIGYLKILQMGNTDPNNTKQENKYEVKPQYKELSKQLIMQHAIIDAMKCMRAIKDRISIPVYQLAIISVKPIYHAQPISRWKSSVCDHRSPSDHHSSVVDTRIRIISANLTTSITSMFTLKLLNLLNSYLNPLNYPTDSSKAWPKLSRTSNLLRELNNQLLSSSNQNFSVAIPTVKNLTPVLLLNKALAANTNLRTVGNSYPTAGISGITIGFHRTKKSAASRSSPRSFHSFKWVTIERANHRDSSATKIAQIIGGER
ncbi:hypothetical protein F511_38142 [Dorcoceras hygrometricum]|uniref:Uncharacterized protein n=1 Tax=Dorcoceras hygrometricum TaxID=472368 RepID=A0A2Z7CZG4_9LAMI|nr:hypothetical protein F511_38142 [Dorcoceras hygrometricum]